MNKVKDTDFTKLTNMESVEGNTTNTNGPLDDFLDNLEECFFTVDVVANKITYATKGCMKVFGYSREALMEDVDLWHKIIHPDDRDWVLKSQSSLAQGQTLIRQYQIVQPDGTVRWVLSKVIPKLDEEGKLIKLNGYTIDITDKKAAELKLEKYNTLMYQISHDLRGPLNAAKNYLAIALSKVEGEPAHGYLVKINDSYNKLEAHILSLLDLGRLNQTESVVEKIEMLPFVRNIIGMVDGMDGFDKIKFTTDIKAPFDICSDRQYLQSVVFNLVSNAIKFRRSITDSSIHISASSNNNVIEIKVADNGMGIAESMKANVFRMFAKGNKGETGNGLGLYIVRKLTEKLKGTIDMESEEGKGTTFRICVPSFPPENN